MAAFGRRYGAKVCDQIERQRALKRGRNELVAESALDKPNEVDRGPGLDGLSGDEPTPQVAALVVDEYLCLRNALGDDSLRQVLDLRLQLYTTQEIAAQLGCAEATVARKLRLIRNAWTKGAIPE